MDRVEESGAGAEEESGEETEEESRDADAEDLKMAGTNPGPGGIDLVVQVEEAGTDPGEDALFPIHPVLESGEETELSGSEGLGVTHGEWLL